MLEFCDSVRWAGCQCVPLNIACFYSPAKRPCSVTVLVSSVTANILGHQMADAGTPQGWWMSLGLSRTSKPSARGAEWWDTRAATRLISSARSTEVTNAFSRYSVHPVDQVCWPPGWFGHSYFLGTGQDQVHASDFIQLAQTRNLDISPCAVGTKLLLAVPVGYAPKIALCR